MRYSIAGREIHVKLYLVAFTGFPCAAESFFIDIWPLFPGQMKCP